LYHDEIRDGYLVKADMKKVWNRQLEMWQEVDRICRKHDITYWAAYGTLLGAARHKGYIPWDEDLDLCMMRPDYNRFLDVLDDELDANFSVGRQENSATKIVHNQTTLISVREFDENLPQGLLIDVFPLDIVADDTSTGFVALNSFKEVFAALYDPSRITRHVQQGGCLFNDKTFLQNVSALTDAQDKRKFFKLFTESIFEQSDMVAWFDDTRFGRCEHNFRKEWFRETIYLPFETIELPAPKMFDEVLTSYYGDWRTPVRDGQNRMGLIYSADIPWRVFLQQFDFNFLNTKGFTEVFK